jgi:hypothetical protein
MTALIDAVAYTLVVALSLALAVARPDPLGFWETFGGCGAILLACYRLGQRGER